jgi:hypothetical protein
MSDVEHNQEDTFEPAEVFVIEDLETLRACLHPLRLAIRGAGG